MGLITFTKLGDGTICHDETHEEWMRESCFLSGTIDCAGCDRSGLYPDGCPSDYCDELRADAYQRQVERAQSGQL